MVKTNYLNVEDNICFLLQDDKQSDKIEVIGGDNLENLKGKVIKS